MNGTNKTSSPLLSSHIASLSHTACDVGSCHSPNVNSLEVSTTPPESPIIVPAQGCSTYTIKSVYVHL
jgi:hypothetical protein